MLGGGVSLALIVVYFAAIISVWSGQSVDHNINDHEMAGNPVKQYRNPTPATDCGVLRKNGNNELEVLLIQRGKDPFKGNWAFPGGFIDYGEEPSQACLRELEEETTLKGKDPVLVGVYGEPDRDPRKHILSIFYSVLVEDASNSKPTGSDDAAHSSWIRVSDIKYASNSNGRIEMAFDHAKLLADLLVQNRLST